MRLVVIPSMKRVNLHLILMLALSFAQAADAQ